MNPWRTTCLVKFLLASLFALTLQLPSAFAQCGPQWFPGEGVPGVRGTVYATTVWDPDGPGPKPPKLIVAGGFWLAGTTLAKNIAGYDPSTGKWSPLGSGTDSLILALTVMPNGDLVAAGCFTTAGGLPVQNIARWNGSEWSSLGPGLDGRIEALAVMPNGDLAAGGDFFTIGGVSTNGIARWNGLEWSPLGTGITSVSDPRVAALAVMPDGDLVAGGSFPIGRYESGAHLSRWNGTAWSSMATIAGGLYTHIAALEVLSNGDLIAGGHFRTIGGVSATNMARWNGSAWIAMDVGVISDASVHSFALMPNGDLIAGGEFSDAGGVPANRVARWNGSEWSPLGLGVDSTVYALAALPNGDLVVSGSFFTAGGKVSAYFARYGSFCSCPADLDDGTGTQRPDGGVDINDLLFFLAQYEAGSTHADLDDGSGAGTPDGAVTIEDLLFFLAHYETGC